MLFIANLRKSYYLFSYSISKRNHKIIKLEFAEAPIITYLTAVDSSFNEGTPVYATCKATGRPDPDVAWIHNGKIQIAGPKSVHLNFSAISKSDAGMYTCRANNSVGSTKKHVNLVIYCKYFCRSLSWFKSVLTNTSVINTDTTLITASLLGLKS